MASSIITKEDRAALGKQEARFIEGIGFDRISVLLGAWFVGGTFLDGWAHSHGFVDNTFFTPWHAALYSGYFATAIALIVATLINHTRGRSWLTAIPRGYELALLGVPIFTIAGVLDLVWHNLFGFEVGIEPLLSPSHLLLALGAIMMVSGPMRAAWQRSESLGWSALLPAVISLLAVFSVFSFFTSFDHPVVDTYLITHASNSDKSRLVAGILIQAATMMGMLFYAMRRWQLPTGTFTLIITVNTALMTVFANEIRLIPVALITGITADLLYWSLKPSSQKLDSLRIFAFVVPLTYYLLYFGMLNITQGINWSIHLWLGSAVLTGVVGLLLSYLMAPAPATLEK